MIADTSGSGQVSSSSGGARVNKCADWLAKRGCSMQEDFAVFYFPFTAYLETLLAKDINGLYYCRFAAASMASVAG